MQVKLEEIEELKAEVQMLRESIELLIENTSTPEVVDVKFIAKKKNVSPTSLRNNYRYLLPNYGESDYPGDHARWDWKTWQKWDSIPVKQRKLAYRQEVMSRHQKKENRLSGANA